MRFNTFNTLILVIISIIFLGCNTTPKPVDNKTPTEKELQDRQQEEQKKKQEEEQRQREQRERQERETAAAKAAEVARSINSRNLTRVRVNQEIVNWIQQLKESGEDIQRLIFYLDKSFSLEIDEGDILPLVDIAYDGMLVINAPTPQPPINFSDIQQGKIITFTPEANETFVITTEAANKHIAMRFRKNAQHDYYYELFSMVIDSDNYNLLPLKPIEEFPMLYIYALIDERIRDEREYTADFLAVHNEHLKDARHYEDTTHNKEEIAHHEEEIAILEDAIALLEREITYHENEITHLDDKTKDEASNKTGEVNTVNELIIDSKSSNITAVNSPHPNPSAEISSNTQSNQKQTQPHQQNQRTENLIARGTLTGESVYNFVKTKTKNPVISDNEIKSLIGLYIEEADYEEVNHDIAIAQMLYMTSILGNPAYVVNNNFAGLTPVRGVWEEGKFSTMKEGVRAHIQQLRGYAKETLNRAEIVTPRWNMISDFRGSITTLGELSERWSSNPARYKENIEKILKELYTFSDK